MGGWVQKVAVFADGQYTYADKVGGSEKVQNYSDVICELSHTLNGQACSTKLLPIFPTA